MEYFHMYFVLFVIWKYFSIKILKKLASEKSITKQYSRFFEKEISRNFKNFNVLNFSLKNYDRQQTKQDRRLQPEFLPVLLRQAGPCYIKYKNSHCQINYESLSWSLLCH